MFHTHSRFFYDTATENTGGADDAAEQARMERLSKFYGEEPMPIAATTETKEELVDLTIESTKSVKATPKAKEEKTATAAEEEKVKAGISDDDFIAELKRRTGKEDVSELIKPVVDEKEAKSKRKSAALAFGLEKGFIKADELEGYIKANSNPHQTVYQQQLEEAKLESDFDEDTFKSEYEDEFALNADKDSSRYKRGQKRLDALADNIIKSTYGSVAGLDDKYSSFEIDQAKTKQDEADILAKAVPYKEMITSISEELKSFDLQVAGGDNVVPVDASDVIESYIEHYLHSDTVKAEIKRGATKEQITQNIKNAIIIENLSTILQDAENKGIIRYKMALKGVTPAARVAEGKTQETDIAKKREEYYS